MLVIMLETRTFPQHVSPEQEGTKDKKSFKTTIYDILSGEEKATSSSSKDERRAHLALIEKRDSISNSKDDNCVDEIENEINPSYDELFDKYKNARRI